MEGVPAFPIRASRIFGVVAETLRGLRRPAGENLLKETPRHFCRSLVQGDVSALPPEGAIKLVLRSMRTRNCSDILVLVL